MGFIHGFFFVQKTEENHVEDATCIKWVFQLQIKTDNIHKRQTCMILRVIVTLKPLCIKISDQAPPKYPTIAIILHGTALNQAACVRSTRCICSRKAAFMISYKKIKLM